MVNKVLPSQIAIYRDGVGGPSYQKYVVEYEIPGVEALLKGYSQGYIPRLLYCLVDKKINTRLIEKKNNDYANPAPGTTVDQGLIENCPESKKGSFDFYMVAHRATVATALPVYYKVIVNTTVMKEREVE